MNENAPDEKGKGFTLIELIVVIVVAGLLLPAMFAAMQTGVRQQSGVHFSQQQLSLAEATVEELLADRYAPGRGFTYLSPRNYGSESGLAGFTRSVQVKDSRVMGRPAKTATVTISKSGVPDVTLTTEFLENW